MCHGTAHPGLPVIQVGTEQLLRAVIIGQLKHTTESTFIAYHTHMAIGSHYLVCPPSGGYLHG